MKQISSNQLIVSDLTNGLILVQTDKDDIEYISLPQNAGKIKAFANFIVYSEGIFFMGSILSLVFGVIALAFIF